MPSLIATAVGASVLGGVGAIAEGSAEKSAYDRQAANAEVQGQQQQQIADQTAQAQVDQAAEAQAQDKIAAKDAGIQAEQQQALRLQDLNRTIGTIRSTVATRNLTGPSSMALEGAADTYAQRDVMNTRFNAFQTASNYNLAGQVAMSQGNAQASQTQLQGIYDVQSGDASAANLRASGSIAQAAGYTSAMGSLFKAATTANSYFGK